MEFCFPHQYVIWEIVLQSCMKYNLMYSNLYKKCHSIIQGFVVEKSWEDIEQDYYSVVEIKMHKTAIYTHWSILSHFSCRVYSSLGQNHTISTCYIYITTMRILHTNCRHCWSHNIYVHVILSILTTCRTCITPIVRKTYVHFLSTPDWNMILLSDCLHVYI